MTTLAVRRPNAALTFLLLALGAGTFSMLQSLISPVLPTIQHDLGTTQTGASWILIAWLLSAAVATPIIGRVGDLIGKDRALQLVLAAIAVGSAVAALAPNLGWMVVGRVVQGLGGAVYPIAFGIIRDEYPPARVPSAVGALSAVVAAGGGLGTVLAGPVVDGLGWRWLFGIPLVIVVIVGALSRRFVPPSPVRGGGRINIIASVLLAGWLLALLLPVSAGRTWGWDSPASLGLLGAAVACFGAWVAVEARSVDPLIDLRMMRRRAVLTTNIVALLFGAAMFAVITFLPQFIQTPATAGYGFGSTVTTAGLLMLPMLATMAVGGALSGPIRAVVSLRRQLTYGSTLLALGCLGFALWNDTPWRIAIAAGVFGLGLGLAYAAMTSVVVHAVEPTETGAATGMNTNLRNIGGAIGTAMVTAVVTGASRSDGLPSAGGYTAGFLLLAGVATAGIAISLLIPVGID